MDDHDVKKLLSVHGLHAERVEKKTGSFHKELFIIDDRYLLRTSGEQMTGELERIGRVEGLSFVPALVCNGVYAADARKVHYILLDYLPGTELFDMYKSLSPPEAQQAGKDIAGFLGQLHAIKGVNYDIGHYVPALPAYRGSWKTGHDEYWRTIVRGVKESVDDREILALLVQSDAYIRQHMNVLDYAAGPRLLHNDFHPRNILVKNGKFSGVIDWECSQYGEPDFDLLHLVHWCVFPKGALTDMMPLLECTMRPYLDRHPVPHIAERLVIYLLEHDFLQLWWSKGARKEEYLPSLEWWLGGNLEKQLLGNKKTPSREGVY